MLLLLSEDEGPFSDVESLLKQALDLWEGNLDALEEAAHFYDAAMDDRVNARKYATLCRAKALALASSMDEILAEDDGAGQMPEK